MLQAHLLNPVGLITVTSSFWMEKKWKSAYLKGKLKRLVQILNEGYLLQKRDIIVSSLSQIFKVIRLGQTFVCWLTDLSTEVSNLDQFVPLNLKPALN